MSIWPKDTVRSIAESCGITNPKDDYCTALAHDVDYRLQEIIQEATKFMRHSKRSRLTVDDINAALRVRNVEPLYGFTSGNPLRFKKTTANMNDIYYVGDEEVDFDTILNKPLPRVPLDVTFTAHWLAIEGVQPAIPQNPTPSDAKSDLLSKRSKANGTNAAGNEQIDVKPLVKHVLSKELQLYYERITEAVVSEEERLRFQAYESLRSDPGLHQLLPYFVQFIVEKVKQNLRNLTVCESMLCMIQALLSSPHLFVDPYLNQLMPAIISCMVGKRICENPKDDHWSVRDFAARLMALVCQRYGKSYHTMQPRITKTLLHAFLDVKKPITTHYGAIVGLNQLGREVIRTVILPNTKAYADNILREPLQADGTIRQLEASKCRDALTDSLLILIEEDKQAQIDSGEEQAMEDLDDVDEATKASVKDTIGDIIGEQLLLKCKQKSSLTPILEAQV
ncbi:hypothetical protein K450DRAFT_217495 [Umbelopsis ramanniana AG]|uniref:TBP-associated factor 6 n=1 Tax=Umbelopsis ramanniana AG TaxID=1314678 RepID=A0AAD5HJ39_UMBRA|nr:uncharacterized protein K450DRAFT_217495 [Umbelopsis ramanniana AG]KAI8584684.1 hypothetical protein K450DRAFT_217495 [Umbelopsis ramanniana AG]